MLLFVEYTDIHCQPEDIKEPFKYPVNSTQEHIMRVLTANRSEPCYLSFTVKNIPPSLYIEIKPASFYHNQKCSGRATVKMTTPNATHDAIITELCNNSSQNMTRIFYQSGSTHNFTLRATANYSQNILLSGTELIFFVGILFG